MRCLALLLVTSLTAVPLGGCALVAEPCATPVTGTATYVSGSTPPPWHHEWTVELDRTSGTVTWTPGYGSGESWSATFVPDADRVVDACRRLRDAHDSGTPTGGGTLTVRWRADSGRTTTLTTADGAAADVVRSVVPADAWRQAEGGYARWRDARRG